MSAGFSSRLRIFRVADRITALPYELVVPFLAHSLSTSKETAMAKVAAYHTNSPEYPTQTREVHHDHDDCPDGKRIKREHRVSGTGNKRRCKECIKLD